MLTPYDLQKIANKCAILANPYDYTLNNKIIIQTDIEGPNFQVNFIENYKEFIDSLLYKVLKHQFKDDAEDHKFLSSKNVNERVSSNYLRYEYVVKKLSLHLQDEDKNDYGDYFRTEMEPNFDGVSNIYSNALLFRQFNSFEINLNYFLRLKNSDITLAAKDSYYLKSPASYNAAMLAFNPIELEAMFTFGLYLKESIIEELSYLLTSNSKLLYSEIKQKIHVYNLLDSISKKEKDFNVITSYNNSFNLTSQFFEFIPLEISNKFIVKDRDEEIRLDRWIRLFNHYKFGESTIFYANMLEKYIIYYIETLHIVLHKMSKQHSQVILDLFRINGDNKFLLNNIYNPYTSTLHSQVEEIIAIKDNELRFEAIKTYLNSDHLRNQILKECEMFYQIYNKLKNPTDYNDIATVEKELNNFTFPNFVAKFVMTCNHYAITRDAIKTAVILLEYIKVNKVEVNSKANNLSDEMLEALSNEQSEQSGFKDPFADTNFDMPIDEKSESKKDDKVSLATELDNTISAFKEKGHEFTLKEVNPSENAKSLYLAVSQKIKLLNSLLIKQIRDIKTYNQGSKLSGLSQGKIDSKNLYKYNTSDNLFYNNKYEVKESDLAFGIVLDASGSMNGEKIADGKVSMVLLHETLRALNINHAIIDHTAKGHHSCIIRKYHDFKESKNYDISKSYGIMDIVSREGNNDAGALYYMEQALLKTNNKDKVCLIFSDGEPTECSEQELKEQVKSMERKGIKVIGIGINLPKIAEYYTDYANGKNLSEMIKIITDILRRYVLEK